MFSFIYAWTNDGANNRDANDLRRYLSQCDITVMNEIDMFSIQKYFHHN